MKRIVVASDSFKGSLTSLQVAGALEQGIHDVFPSCEVVKVNVADGGEGTMDALADALGGRTVPVQVHDPLCRPVTARYVIVDGGQTAVIEMSVASGLTLLKPDERNPMNTSTFGTGELVADALHRGCRRFLIGIGGSATNDAGMGMLSALGVRFLDQDGKVLDGIGRNMENVADIDLGEMAPEIYDSEFIVACDVASPFCGPDGAAYVFAPQKGADSQMVGFLDRGMSHLAEVVLRVTGRDIADVSGAGAAGGLGGAFLAFMDARLERGVDMVLDALGFDSIIEGADLVITGEGRIDAQTMTGKTPYGVLQRALAHRVPALAVGGSVDLKNVGYIKGFEHIVQATPEGMALSEAMKPETAAANIRLAISTLLRSL
ncbi:MAG: glycerate kinase [Bacteroidales bacterium]|nr:glycerate kinase [Bacteroidales bacterium]